MRWLERIFRGSHLDEELAEEVQEHIEERTEQIMRLENLSRDEARQIALRAFGNPTLVKTRSREVWEWQRLEALAADFKLVARRLSRSPGFAASVLLTLSIGIGANTAVFSVVNSVLLKPLPYPQPDRLVTLSLQAPGAAGLASFRDGLLLSPSMYLTFAEHNRAFESLGVWSAGTANLTGIGQPKEVHVITVSNGLLETLAVPALAGRWLNADDQKPNASKSVMIGYGFWQRQFGGQRSVIGKTIRLDTQSWQIVGIMPRGFRVVDSEFDILRPSPASFDPHHQIMEGFAWNGVGRLKDGVSIRQADADISSLIPVWMDSWSDGPNSNSHFFDAWRIAGSLKPLKQQVVGGIGGVLWLVMGTIGMVMLIVCTNVANLLLVRADSRQQELAVRAALGAGRGRIARELIFESLALGVVGGVGGIAVAYAALRCLSSVGPVNLPRLSEISLSPESLGFTAGLAVFSGLFFGSIVSLKYSHIAPGAGLRVSSRTASAGRDRHRSQNVLVVAQVAMALVLLVCAGLMMRSFAVLLNTEPGFADAEHLQTMRVAILPSIASDAVAVTRMQNEIADKLAQLPGVSSVGYAADVPMDGFEPNWNSIFVQGRDPWGAKSTLPMRLFNYTSPRYFSTMGSRMIAGREFTWDDVYNQRPVVILSENLARELFGSAGAAVGKQITYFEPMPWHQIIGVVEDARHNGVDAPAPACVYWPTMSANLYGPEPLDAVRGVTFVARSQRAGSQSLTQEMQQAVWQVNGDLPVSGLRNMHEIESRSLERISFTLTMIGIAAAMALALGVIGIYGVISYTVSQRMREMGIRIALGAQKSQLRWMFVRTALQLTGVGLIIGFGVAAGVVQLMRSLLFGVRPLDPLSFGVMTIVLMMAAVLASYLPASRVARINPADVLKAE
ncbi:MAG TPA: ABC transporter permease [Terracidiphilus sp.]|jgi:predicted permease|nr:ABC transporter permease [Terracidiphilus sp.]